MREREPRDERRDKRLILSRRKEKSGREARGRHQIEIGRGELTWLVVEDKVCMSSVCLDLV